MKANELRIGNSILINGAVINRITPDTIKDIWLKENGIQPDNEYNYEDIPLTEDWLLRFRFRHDPEQEIFNREDICLSYSDNYDGYTLFVSHEYETGKPIKFLHQLQNLYFALTGEELEINL